MFRTVPLSIISSFSLYTQQWYMPYRFSSRIRTDLQTRGWTVRDRIPVGTRFSARPEGPCGPPNLLYNGYPVFPGGKVLPGRAADHSPPSSAAVMEE